METQHTKKKSKNSSRGKFIATETYIKKQEKPQISNLNLCLKELEKERIEPKLTGEGNNKY